VNPAAPRLPLPAALALTFLALSGCATIAPPGVVPVAAASSASAPAAPATAASASAPTPTPAPTRPDASGLRAFDDVVKGATRQEGFLSFWRKDDKLWIEVPLAQLDKPFLLSANVSQSVGERWLYAGQMGAWWLVNFRRTSPVQMQLVALNTDFAATQPQMREVVAQSFTNSLLASTAIVSAPHPTRQSVLIDGGFLLSDLPGYGTSIDAVYRLPFALDRSNSFFEKSRATEDVATIGTRLHFGMARYPAPPLTPPAVPVPAPATLPDARSLFVGFVYSFTKLPDEPMSPRMADPRLGHFTHVVSDFSSDRTFNPRKHYIARWRLEQQVPGPALSPPKQPIVFWLDKNIPVNYRASVEAGILEWNKAFEKIGFKDAIVVRQQADTDEWDTLDSRHASIRWFTGRDVGVAVGPHQADPRTGEIFDADIAMSDAFARHARRMATEDLGRPQALPAMHAHDAAEAACEVGFEALREMDFSLDLLELRGDLPAGGPAAEAIVQAVVKDTIMHEVGHALGLKHNFKGSTVISRQQLRDAGFTATHALSGSVMDYNPFNTPLAGERPVALNNTTLGPYDYWAIEYAYKPIAPANEAAELAKIAARSSDPLLAYSDDQEAGEEGIDPLVNRGDLGDDPLAYHRRRLALSQELWARVQARTPQPDDDPVRDRRALLNGFFHLPGTAAMVGKYVGGLHTTRDVAGAPGARPTFVPVEPAKQRDALHFLTQSFFSADSFKFEPQFLARLAPDYNETERGPVSIPAAVLSVQTTALDRLMSAGVASRLLDLPLYLPPEKRRGVISLAEVYGTVQDAVWSEVRNGREIDRLRRNLQREHLRRVQALLVRGSGALPADALSLLRYHAVRLQAQLRQAVAAPGGRSVESRAHLESSLSQLDEALRATMLRS